MMSYSVITLRISVRPELAGGQVAWPQCPSTSSGRTVEKQPDVIIPYCGLPRVQRLPLFIKNPRRSARLPISTGNAIARLLASVS